ncbi:MAG TPA: hypothetical protein VK772_07735 [Puia sp.]|jgi:hypothetical protein|nr:hypothetical protein [Puia sp.]
MSNFTVRVEHYEPPTAMAVDYRKLQVEMANEGFIRNISKDNKSYHLPTAEYSQVIDLKTNVIFRNGKKSRFQILKDFSVFVTKDLSPREFFNLNSVK